MAERPLLEGLYRDHHALAANLEALQETLRGLAPSPAASADEVVSGHLRERFQICLLGLRHHFRQEEEALYPEARQCISQGAGPGDIFGGFFAAEAEDDLGCHTTIVERLEDILSQLQEIEEAGHLEAARIGRLRSAMTLTRGLYDRHSEKEDRFIYPFLQQSLDFEQRTRVRQRLQEVG